MNSEPKKLLLSPQSSVLSLSLIVFFFLHVRTAFLTGKTGPHPFGGFVQAAVIMGAGKIAYSLALLAHHGVRTVFVRSFGLNELPPRTFFLRHAYKLPICPVRPKRPDTKNAAPVRKTHLTDQQQAHYNLLFFNLTTLGTF